MREKRANVRVEDINTNLQEIIRGTAIETLVVKLSLGTRRHTMWYDEEMKRVVSEKNKKMMWLKGRTEQKRAEYVIARNRTEIVKKVGKKTGDGGVKR